MSIVLLTDSDLEIILTSEKTLLISQKIIDFVVFTAQSTTVFDKFFQ
jgi:hypothetical protein